MSGIDHLHSETKMLQLEDHLNHLSAQYLVHCLDTENVCHHINTLDHPPREMTETLFTRHNQTVLPLLANTKKASLQAVHTSFVNTEIDNMTDNRGLQTTQPTSGVAVTVVSSCCANCVEPPRPQQWGPDLPFFGHADPLDGWRYSSQKRVMSRPIQVRQL